LERAFVAKFDNPQPKRFEQLTLNQYIDVVPHSACSSKVQPLFGSVERQATANLLKGVRDTRNALSHFREISPSERARLRVCARWLEQCARPRKPQSAPEAVTQTEGERTHHVVIPVEEAVTPSDSKYARLGVLAAANSRSVHDSYDYVRES
jgi:hypothetical protein